MMTYFSTHPLKWHYFLALAIAFTILDISVAQHKSANANRYRQYRRDDDSDLDPKKLFKELERKILNNESNVKNVSSEKPRHRMGVDQAKQHYRNNKMKRYQQARESPKFLKAGKFQGTAAEGDSYNRKIYADNGKQTPMRKRGRRNFRDFSDFNDYRMEGNENRNDGSEKDGLFGRAYFRKNHGPNTGHLNMNFENSAKSNYEQRRAPIREVYMMNDDDDDDDDDDQRETENLNDAEAIFLNDPENYDYLIDPKNSDYMDEYENDSENLDDSDSADLNEESDAGDDDEESEGNEEDAGDVQSDSLDDNEYDQ